MRCRHSKSSNTIRITSIVPRAKYNFDAKPETPGT